MNRIFKFFSFAFIAICFAISPLAGVQAQGTGPADLAPLTIGSGTIVPDQYIVVLKPTSEASAQSSAIGALQAAGGKVVFEYGSALKGFAAILPAQALQALRANPQVAYIEADQVVNIGPDLEPGFGAGAGDAENSDIQAQAVQSPATWGLDRIDQRTLPLNNSYSYLYTGAGVHAYIIDTGIRSTHTQFTGRATKDFDAIGDGQNGNDCAGHGTHVAGTIGGVTYGVAKAVRLHAVRVLNCLGSGTFAGVIAGINWVSANRILPAVANMSLGGGFSSAVNDAVTNAIAHGVTFAVAAGNDNLNACNYSPASTPAAITVGSTTSTDSRSSFSNFGPCLDIFAPGSSITSAWIGSDTATNTISGTSMATPHTAGVAALYLQANPTASPATVAAALINSSTPNLVIDPAGSVNRLLYSILGAPASVVPTPITPSGATLDTTPTFGWSKVPAATYYQFYLYKGAALVYAKTVAASTCGATSICYNTPTTVLPVASYSWKVRAVVGGTWRAFSALKLFSITTYGPAFASTFTSDALGWSAVYGAWARSSTGFYWTPGIVNNFASAKHANYYGPLTYQAKMKRFGSCTGCANFLIIRGTPTPLEATAKDWNKGLRFQYSNSGYFSVWKVDNGTWTAIKTWTPTSAILQNNWNILKVSASGGNMKYYINNILVWSGAVVAEPYGQVGIGTYTDATANYLYFDWVTLSTVATAGPDVTEFAPVEEITGLGDGSMAP
jgi:subtilisin family serine protease